MDGQGYLRHHISEKLDSFAKCNLLCPPAGARVCHFLLTPEKDELFRGQCTLRSLMAATPVEASTTPTDAN